MADASPFELRELTRLALLAEYMRADREGGHADWQTVAHLASLEREEARRLVAQLCEAGLLGGRAKRSGRLVFVYGVAGITLNGERSLREGLTDLEATGSTEAIREAARDSLGKLSAGVAIARGLIDLIRVVTG